MEHSNRTFVIAEAGVNHNGDLSQAKELIKAAQFCGADAVKFQMFQSDEIAVPHAPLAQYQNENLPGLETQSDMLKSLELSQDDFRVLAQYCDDLGIEFLCTPFDSDSLQFLVDEIGMSTVKVASSDITNAPLLVAAALTGLPIILSTGMSTLGDIENALAVIAATDSLGAAILDSGAPKTLTLGTSNLDGLSKRVTLLQCTSAYPAPATDANLLTLPTLRRAFGLQVGYSDHANGIALACAAVALGATVVEKHLTLDNGLGGPDHAASSEPSEFAELVRSIRQVEQGLGNGRKIIMNSEAVNLNAMRRGLYAAQEISAGQIIRPGDIRVARPLNSTPASQYFNWLGAEATRNYLPNDPL